MEEKKRGKNILIGILISIIIILSILVILLTTNTINLKKDLNSIENPESNNTTTSIKIDNEKEYIYDSNYSYNNKYTELNNKNNKENTYTTDGLNTIIWNEGKQYVKDLKVPYININTTEVKEINEKLKKLYEEYASRFDEYAISTQGGSQILTYYTYTSNNILSLVVTYGHQTTDLLYPEYLIYNFDLSNGNLLDYNTFLNKLNWTKEDASLFVEKKINDYIVANIPMEHQSKTSSIDKFTEEVNNNKLLYFIDNNGNINYIATIYIEAGRGYNHQIITIDKNNY